MTRTRGALATALLVGALVTGCGVPGDGGPATPTPGAEATPTPTASPPGESAPTQDTVRAEGIPVTAGEVVVLHALAVGADADAGALSSAQPDGDVTVLTATPGASGTGVEVLLAPPADARLDVQDDGSFLVLAGDGTFLGGAARPVTAEGGGPVRLTEDDGLLRAVADAGDLQVRVSGSALAGADWGEREGGRSLAVAPTPWARSAGQAGEAAVWAELVAAVPEADTQVMRDQLTCHVLGAPDKETWNLEPWRPDIGLLGVLAAACNPT